MQANSLMMRRGSGIKFPQTKEHAGTEKILRLGNWAIALPKQNSYFSLLTSA
ncbi:hypothetical protein [Scytonema hofmannii]|uniref:hypothetical protein n=1 Tax=Scytonema hofmannii TaxID=34078 RepID=UPI001314A22F|nr:hypothetical protein [Scytonema hofmannii]